MTRRVLVARLDSMGDVLVSGPAIRAVAREAEVVMLCGPRGAEAAALLPGVSDLIVWEAPWISDPAPDATSEHVDRFMQLIRRARIDEAVILTSFHQSPLPLALLLRLAGIARVTGASVDYSGSLLNVRLRPGEDLPEDIPEPERARAIAAAAGFMDADDGLLRLVDELPDTSHLTGEGRYVVLHPGAAVPARTWPIDGFVQTAALLSRAGFQVVLTGSEGERELTAAVSREHPEVVDLAGACTLAELAGVLAAAEALVAGNTGPAHLAAAVGTPIVSLFAPVVPAIRWAPYGTRSVVLGDQNAPCRNTRARQCPVPGHPCLSRVSAEDVVNAISMLTSPTISGLSGSHREQESNLEPMTGAKS